jgi:transcriptional regulator with XRE-family HTH domain
METMGERVRKHRTRLGYSIADLAAIVGVTEGAIRAIETGAVAAPSFFLGLRFADTFGVDPCDLAYGKSGPLSEQVTLLRRRVDAIEKRLP